MVEVRWTDQALSDIENIAEFISKDSFKYAEIQVQRFFSKVDVLISHPHSGRIVPETNNKLIRELIQGNYRIIYKIISVNQIDILTVHNSRKLLINNPAFDA
jgi:addiction module RelE/StbE family toxin